MENYCVSCMKFPCGRSNCNAIIPSDCKHYLEGGKTMRNIIYDSLSNLWAYGIHELETKFNTDYGAYYIIKDKQDFVELEIHTGGCSNNEQVMKKLEDSLFWTFFWYESKRDGYYVFKKPRQKRKYERRNKK